MRLCAVIFLWVAVPGVICITDEMKELAKTLHNTCVAETGVEEALIDKANKEKVLEDDDKLKCYLKCIMRQVGCISEAGIMDEDAAIAVLPEEFKSKAEPIVKSCGTKVGANPCENAWLTHKCYLEADPSIGPSCKNKKNPTSL